MKRWWLTIVLLLSLGINIGLLAAVGIRKAATPRIDRPPEVLGLEEKLARVGRDLGLEGERREEFLRVQLEFVDTVKLRRMRLVKVRSALRRELTSRNPSLERVERLERELGEAYVELERAFIDMVTQSREVLGPQQHRRYLRMLGTVRERLR